MKFEAGDRIKYLNQSGGGVILKILPGNKAEIEDDLGFNMVAELSELVAKGKSGLNEAEIRMKLKQKGSILSREGSTERKFGTPSARRRLNGLIKKEASYVSGGVEIDLHIEELVEKPLQLADGEKLKVQLQYAKECLDEARDLRIGKIVFIHGIGKGVLRRELKQWIDTQADMESGNADPGLYGFGAMEVRLKGLFKD